MPPAEIWARRISSKERIPPTPERRITELHINIRQARQLLELIPAGGDGTMQIGQRLGGREWPTGR